MNNQISASSAGSVIIGDLRVNRIGFGAMRITGEGVWGEPPDREGAKQVLKRAIELDVNFIDTSDAYGPGVSERLIREALHPYKGITVATKGGVTYSARGQWTPDGSPKHLKEACEASLKRLGVEQIDLYQYHIVDPKVPFEDSFQALLDLQQAGKIRYIGLSNIEPKHFEIALRMGTFVSVENNYNVLSREQEDVLKLCEQHNVAFIPYWPTGGNQENGIADAVLSELADKYQATPRQIGLAWLLAHSPVTLPIPGTSSVRHLEENVAAGAIELAEEDKVRLDGLTG
jgi:aryl-alcohol dehydrogenase-like predicted oxidoreductase